MITHTHTAITAVIQTSVPDSPSFGLGFGDGVGVAVGEGVGFGVGEGVGVGSGVGCGVGDGDGVGGGGITAERSSTKLPPVSQYPISCAS